MAIDFYQHLQRAYDFYNEKLFDGQLEDSLIVFQRKTRTFGYISYNRHSIVGGSSYMHELALNPDYFAYRTIIETLSTLLHEQCHLFQHQMGTETRKTYHNQAFRDLMVERGLQTSHTGEEGGKEVGQNMTHYIMPDGKFLEVTLEFLRDTDFKSFYDRYTPKYIEPHQFYNRSILFISRMQGRVKVEDIIPPYLLEHIQENPHILQGGAAIEPTLTVEDNPDGDDVEPTDTQEPELITDDPIEVEVTQAKPTSTEMEDEVEEEEGEDVAIKEVKPVVESPKTAEIQKIVAKVTMEDIVSRLSSPEQLLEPIQQLIDSRKSAVQTQQIITEIKKATNSKCKFTCDGCQSNLWGKDSLNVICADCDVPYRLVD